MTSEAEIRELLKSWEQAMHKGDAEAVGALYEPDVVLFDIAPPLKTQGFDTKGLDEWFKSWDGPVRVEVKEPVIEVREDLAVVRSLNLMTGKKKGSDEKSQLWLRCTICLRRTPAGWRVFHEHTSVPMKMDGSGKAAIDLTPESTS